MINMYLIPFDDVQAATGYTSSNGMRYILIINEALWMPELHNSLMNPNQLRHFGVEVQDNLFSSEPMVIKKEDDDEGLIACLKSQGTNIFIETWTPTEKDLVEARHITITSDEVWDPHAIHFPGTTESEMAVIESYNVSSVHKEPEYQPTGYSDGYHESIKIFDIRDFNARMIGSVVIPTRVANGPLHQDELLPTPSFISSQRHSNTTPEDLSEVWNISIEQAKMTLEATTQHHTQSAIMPLARSPKLTGGSGLRGHAPASWPCSPQRRHST